MVIHLNNCSKWSDQIFHHFSCNSFNEGSRGLNTKTEGFIYKKEVTQITLNAEAITAVEYTEWEGSYKEAYTGTDDHERNMRQWGNFLQLLRVEMSC